MEEDDDEYEEDNRTELEVMVAVLKKMGIDENKSQDFIYALSKEGWCLYLP